MTALEPLAGELVLPSMAPEDTRPWSERDPQWTQVREDVDGFLAEFRSTNTKLAYANHLGAWWHPVTGVDRPEVLADVLNGLSWFLVCRASHVHPYDAPRRLVVRWLDLLAETPQRRGQSRGKPLAPSTQLAALAALASFYEYLVEDVERIPCTPVVVNRRRRQLHSPAEPTSRSLSEEEFVAMLAASHRFEPVDLRARAVAVVAFVFTTGCRVSELTGLNRDAFGVDQGQRVVDLLGKGGRTRRVPVPGWVWDLLLAYWASDRRGGQGLVRAGEAPAGSGPAFWTRTGRRMDRQGVTALLQHVARLAGVEDPEKVRPHVARHTVVDEALALGVDLREIQRLLGHASLATTGRYGGRDRGYAASPAIVIGNRAAQLTA